MFSQAIQVEHSQVIWLGILPYKVRGFRLLVQVVGETDEYIYIYVYIHNMYLIYYIYVYYIPYLTHMCQLVNSPYLVSI